MLAPLSYEVVYMNSSTDDRVMRAGEDECRVDSAVMMVIHCESFRLLFLMG